MSEEITLKEALNEEGSCINCSSCEEGGHYCLLHGISLKNADTWTCVDFEYRE